MKQYAPAAGRNRDPIARVLGTYLSDRCEVLEIGAGTGEHALHMANHFEQVSWQPSDANPQALKSIDAWAAESVHANISPGIALDASACPWPPVSADVVVCINMIHISPWQSCLGLIRGARHVLPLDGILFLYGPFFREAHKPEPSNLAFDRSLRSRNEDWGIRHLNEVHTEAKKNGFHLVEVLEMPANNLSVVFRKVESER